MSRLFGQALDEATVPSGGSLRGRLKFGPGDDSNQSGRSYRPPRRGGSNSGRSRNNRGRGNYSRGNGPRINPRSRLDDDDDDGMEGAEQTKRSTRYNPYGGGSRRNRLQRGRGNNDGAKARLNSQSKDSSQWFKVLAFNCKSLGKDAILRELTNTGCPSLNAVQFHWLGDNAGFFVEGSDAADQVRSCHRKISAPDGKKIHLSVKPSPGPKRFANSRNNNESQTSGANPDLVPVLQECLAQKFDVQQQSLSLQDIENDAVLKQHGVKGAFYQHWFASAVFKLIASLCPTLRGLDLSHNKMRHLTTLKDVAATLPNLEHLSLGNNELNNIEDLEVLKDLKNLKTLILDGNPLVKSFASKPLAYTSEVRNRLPQIETVDGQKLPPPIAFDVPKALPLPTVKDNYLVDNSVQGAISGFLQSYIEVFDSDNRQRLLDAYHDDAVFSLCVNTNARDSRDTQESHAQSLSSYIRSSRNLKRITDQSKRASLLKITKSATVATLTSDFKKTKHDLSSFNIDLILAQSAIMCFTVRGRFVEVDTSTARAFTRTFVVVPNASAAGFLIVNDQLQIRNVTSKEAASQSIGSSPSATPLPPTNASSGHDDLVLKFSAESKMNAAFSRQCLQDNDWDYQRAAVVFTNLQASGKIPPEAFVT